jgi:hypothetical protein
MADFALLAILELSAVLDTIDYQILLMWLEKS